MIIWLIGISGAGKTTVGRILTARLRDQGRCAVLLDGDDLREVWADRLGHTMAERRRNHERISRLCKLLGQDRKLDLVVPALSIFPDLRAWNRANLPDYFEVFLDLPVDEAARRDPKGIYAAARRGEARDVAGLDLPFPPPEHADLAIGLPDILESPERITDRIMEKLP